MPIKQTPPSLRSRLFRGAGAQAFGQVVRVIIRLAEVPLLLSFWGADLYGEWLMLAAIPAYLVIGDGGFAWAACRDMTMRSGAGDQRGALAVFQSTWLLLLIVSIIVFLLAWVFVTCIPLHQWLGFSKMGADAVQIVLLLLVIHGLVGFQEGLLTAGFWVSGKYPTGMVLSYFTLFLEFSFFALAVLLQGGPVQAAAGYVLGRILGTGLFWFTQRRVSPWLVYGFAHCSLSELRRLTAPAFASLAFPLGNALNIQGIRLVVGLAISPAAVAVFAPLRTLSNLAMQPRFIINRMVEPELAFAYGAGDNPTFLSLFFKSCHLTFWGVLTVVFAVAVVASWLFPIWTGGKVVIYWPAFVILLAGVWINSLWHTALMVPCATNRHVRLGMFYFCFYGCLACAAGYVFSIYFQLVGAALAIMIAEVLMAYIVLRAALKMSEIKYLTWWQEVFKSPFDDLKSLIKCKRTNGRPVV